MIEVKLTDPIPLSITLEQGPNTGLFPQAIIYDAADSVVATRNLTEVAPSTGRYRDAGFTPLVEGKFTAHFIVYTDAGHTTESVIYDRDEETFKVRLDIFSGDIGLLEPFAERSIGRMVQKQVNRVAISGTSLQIYETDDSTINWTQELTTDANAIPITEIDTD